MSGKRLTIYIIALIVVMAVFLGYRHRMSRTNQSSQKSASQISNSATSGVNPDENATAPSDETDQDFEAQCTNGEWIKIADIQGEAVTLSGKLRKVYPDDDVPDEIKSFQYYVEGTDKAALSGSDLSKLDNFENLDVELQGVKSLDGRSVEVAQVRCAGSETDPAIIGARTNLMNWIKTNIDSIAPKKAPYQRWTIDTVEFVDEKNAYVEYYDTVEDDENSDVTDDTRRKILLEANAKPDGNYDAKVLAYWEMGEDDFVLKAGTDKFEDATDTYMYQYDADEQSWTRI